LFKRIKFVRKALFRKRGHGEKTTKIDVNKPMS